MSEINPAVLEKLAAWWRGLDNDRAARAILRRAESITAVALTAPYQRLYRQLCQAGWDESAPDYRKERLAAVVGLLAHISANGPMTLPEAMSDGDKPPVSELRFQRLLESRDLDTLFSGLRRALPLIERTVNVKALAGDVFNWGDKVRKEWAYGYKWPEKAR